MIRSVRFWGFVRSCTWMLWMVIIFLSVYDAGAQDLGKSLADFVPDEGSIRLAKNQKGQVYFIRMRETDYGKIALVYLFDADYRCAQIKLISVSKDTRDRFKALFARGADKINDSLYVHEQYVMLTGSETANGMKAYVLVLYRPDVLEKIMHADDDLAFLRRKIDSVRRLRNQRF